MDLTIFTPTYNRRELLARAYESLKSQTCHDFNWLIIDDGSTDNTGELVRTWQDEGVIPIEYHYVENGGKMRAHNRGVRLCKTEWFLCLDSDDRLVHDAVECILGHVYGIGGDDQKLAGLIAHKGRSETELLSGVDFPKGVNRSTLYGLYLKGFRGETTIVFRTGVISKYPFPEIEGEKYVPEDYIYDKIDSEYDYIVLSNILTVCELVSEGYTDSVRALKENNKEAWYLYYEQRARITPMSRLKLKYLGFYRLYAAMSGHSIREAAIPGWQKMLGLPGEIILRATGRM